MARITGRVEIVANGKLLLNKEGAVASGIGISGEPGYVLEPVTGDTGIHGFSEKMEPARLEVSVTDRADVSLDQLARIYQNGTIIFRAAGGGKVYTMQNATCLRGLSVTAGEGDTPLVFVGPYWTESVS